MKQKTNILFVCSGNTCRSPMAAGYLNSLLSKSGLEHVKVLSAGTSASNGAPASANAIEVMKDLGIDISAHKSMPLTFSLLEKSDIIVVMTRIHKARIEKISKDAIAKTHLLLEFAGKKDHDIGDPIGGSLADYRKCFEQMRPALDNLFLEILSNKPGAK